MDRNGSSDWAQKRNLNWDCGLLKPRLLTGDQTASKRTTLKAETGFKVNRHRETVMDLNHSATTWQWGEGRAGGLKLQVWLANKRQVSRRKTLGGLEALTWNWWVRTKRQRGLSRANKSLCYFQYAVFAFLNSHSIVLIFLIFSSINLIFNIYIVILI